MMTGDIVAPMCPVCGRASCNLIHAASAAAEIISGAGCGPSAGLGPSTIPGHHPSPLAAVGALAGQADLGGAGAGGVGAPVAWVMPEDLNRLGQCGGDRVFLTAGPVAGAVPLVVGDAEFAAAAVGIATREGVTQATPEAGEVVSRAATSLAAMVAEWYASDVIPCDHIPARLIERRLRRFTLPATAQAQDGVGPDWTAARHMLEAWDHWFDGKPGGDDRAARRLSRAGCFAAQAYEDAMDGLGADGAPGVLMRTFLLALIDPMLPELDPLRACNRKPATTAPVPAYCGCSPRNTNHSFATGRITCNHCAADIGAVEPSADPAPVSAGADDVMLGLLACLRDTCAHLSMEVDALKSGIGLFETDGMTSTLSDAPEDANTRDEGRV